MGAASNFVAAKFTAVATTLGEKKAKCQAELVVDVRFWATHEYFQRHPNAPSRFDKHLLLKQRRFLRGIVTHRLEVFKLVNELNDFPDAVLQLAPGCPARSERFTAFEFSKISCNPTGSRDVFFHRALCPHGGLSPRRGRAGMVSLLCRLAAGAISIHPVLCTASSYWVEPRSSRGKS